MYMYVNENDNVQGLAGYGLSALVAYLKPLFLHSIIATPFLLTTLPAFIFTKNDILYMYHTK